jgi:hypothetical protein
MATGLTLRYIIFDPIELLKQTVKDRDIQPVQIAYWAIILMNRLKSQHIDKRDSGRFLTTFTQVPVVVPAATQSQGIVQNRKYVELPGVIFDFDKDASIEYVAYTSDGSPGCPPEYTHVRFERTTPSTSWILYTDGYTQPKPSVPYWSLSKNILTLYGIETVDVNTLEMGIYMPIAPPDQIDLDEPVEFPEELIVILQRQLYDIGRLGLLIPADRTSDGSFQPEGAVPTNKIVPVQNDQQQPAQ